MNDRERVLYREGRISAYYQIVDRINQGDTPAELKAWVLEQRQHDQAAINLIVDRNDCVALSGTSPEVLADDATEVA